MGAAHTYPACGEKWSDRTDVPDSRVRRARGDDVEAGTTGCSGVAILAVALSRKGLLQTDTVRPIRSTAAAAGHQHRSEEESRWAHKRSERRSCRVTQKSVDRNHAVLSRNPCTGSFGAVALGYLRGLPTYNRQPYLFGLARRRCGGRCTLAAAQSLLSE